MKFHHFIALVSLYTLFFIGYVNSVEANSPKKKNIIFMVSDGMGPASLSLARSFKQFRDDLSIDDILTLDKHLIGASRTRSSNSLVTDSAAGATLFSCALKSYNNAIGVDPDQVPCGTILEALKLEGYLTGLVVTTRITDLTPLLFSAHVDYRFQEDMIAQQQLGDNPLGRVVDLMIGGGRCFFHPTADGGCRTDNVDLIAQAEKEGWTYAGTRAEFDRLLALEEIPLPLLSLLLENDIPFDLDRVPEEHPSLEEETRLALRLLSQASKDSEKGFFLLVEGSRIDHAGHSNDPLAQVREVLAYDKAFEAVLEFVENSDDETIVISTSDHETGGLATARQIHSSYPAYLWYPEVLLRANHSGEFLLKKLESYRGSDIHDFVAQEILESDLGITDYTPSDVKRVVEGNTLEVLNDLVSVRSQTGWSTHGHSAVDVNIYAHASNEELQLQLYKNLAGNHENIEIGKFMESWLGLDLLKVTEMIKDVKHSRDVEDFAGDEMEFDSENDGRLVVQVEGE